MRACSRRTKSLKSAATVFLNHHQSSSSSSSSNTSGAIRRNHRSVRSCDGVASSSSSSSLRMMNSHQQRTQFRMRRDSLSSSLHQSHRAHGNAPRTSRRSIPRVIVAYSSSSSSKRDSGGGIQLHPHVLSAYALDVNPNFELTVSTVASVEPKMCEIVAESTVCQRRRRS